MRRETLAETAHRLYLCCEECVSFLMLELHYKRSHVSCTVHKTDDTATTYSIDLALTEKQGGRRMSFDDSCATAQIGAILDAYPALASEIM